MSLSPTEAGKHVGLTKQSIIKAIRSGRLSATKNASGEWGIEPVELFRVWPAVNQDGGKVTPQVDALTPPENGEVVALLKAQINLLKSQLDDVRADREDMRTDRNHWRQIAERSLLTDQRAAPDRSSETPPQSLEVAPIAEPIPSPQVQPEGGFWSRLFGRSDQQGML
jgi:hypothetical protein